MPPTRRSERWVFALGTLPRAWATAVVVGLALTHAACRDGSSGGGESFGLTSRAIVEGLTFPDGLPSPTPLTPIRRFPQLTFSAPVFLTAPPDGSDRIAVVEKAGVIHIFPNDDAVTATTVFLDHRAVVRPDGEGGLLGLAFHPDYATNGFFYVYYTFGPTFDSRVSRWRVDSIDPNRADASSEEVLLEFDQPFANHNGGMIAFGPDGMLYIATGDGGGANDPFDNSQNLGNLLGKVLRLDPDGGVPADNPFVGMPTARGEIWAYGLRNPWRFSFDRATGDLWLGDVGQNGFEEVDLIERGGNYGWRVYEGNSSAINPFDLPASDFAAPVIAYDHSLGASVTGGYVYRGSRLSSLVGSYLYGDFTSGNIWALVYDGDQVISAEQVATLITPSSFGEDEAGEVYAVSFNTGEIYWFEENSPPPTPTFPQLLSETGLFTDLASLTPTPGLIEYDVNVRFWSDGAEKRRWMALPGMSRMGFTIDAAYEFPVGTVLVKHFELPISAVESRRVELRVLLKTAAGWEGYSYRWRDAQNDGDLMVGSNTEDFTIETDGGGTRQQTWYYPSRSDCGRCHTAAAGFVLGIRTRQLNRDFDYALQTDNQLRSWNHIDLFKTSIGDPSLFGRLVNPYDPTSDLDARARSYLAVNCSGCHRPGGPTPVGLDFRYSTPLSLMDAVDVPPNAGDLGLPDAAIIRSGTKESSVLWERMQRTDGFRMPPLGTLEVDTDGVDLIGEWIDAGPTS